MLTKKIVGKTEILAEEDEKECKENDEESEKLTKRQAKMIKTEKVQNQDDHEYKLFD